MVFCAIGRRSNYELQGVPRVPLWWSVAITNYKVCLFGGQLYLSRRGAIGRRGN